MASLQINHINHNSKDQARKDLVRSFSLGGNQQLLLIARIETAEVSQRNLLLRELERAGDLFKSTGKDSLSSMRKGLQNLALRLDRLAIDLAEGERLDLLLCLAENGGKVTVAQAGSFGVLLVVGNQVTHLPQNDRLELPAGLLGANQAHFTLHQVDRLAPGQSLLLASRGMVGASYAETGFITDNEIIESMKLESDPQRMLKRLVSYPLSRNAEGDVSVISISNPHKKPLRLPHPVIVIGVLALLASAAYFVFADRPTGETFGEGGDVVLTSSDVLILVDPAGNESEKRLPSPVQAGYLVITHDSPAFGILRGGDLYIGPTSRVLFLQIEPEAPELSNQVILMFRDFTESLVAFPDSGVTIDLRLNDEITVRLLPSASGVIGVRDSAVGFEVFCISGDCAIENANGQLFLSEGQWTIINAAGEITPTPITEGQIQEWESQSGFSIE